MAQNVSPYFSTFLNGLKYLKRSIKIILGKNIKPSGTERFTIKIKPKKGATILLETEPISHIHQAPCSKLSRPKIIQDKRSPLKAILYRDVFIQINSFIVIQKNYAYLQPFWKGAALNNVDLIWGWISKKEGRKIYVKKKEADLFTKGIFLGHPFTQNWYHWCIETLSKVEIFNQLPRPYKEWPLLVSIQNAPMRNFMDALHFIFPNQEIHFLLHNKTYRVENLIMLDSPMFGNPNPFHYSKIDKNNQIFALQYAQKYAQRMQEGLKPSQSKKRIFLARTQKNRVYNQEEIQALLESMGFITVYCENLSFEEQRQLFHDAEVVAGPTGASWTNLIFSRPETHAIIWAPEFTNKLTTYSDLAFAQNITLTYIYFPTKAQRWIDFMHSNEKTYLSPIELKETILTLLRP